MGMIGHAEKQLGSLELENLLTKIVGQIWITVRDNRVRHAMEFEDTIHENFIHCICGEWVLERKKMRMFGKVIYENYDE
jgi:hypothetical protein